MHPEIMKNIVTQRQSEIHDVAATVRRGRRARTSAATDGSPRRGSLSAIAAHGRHVRRQVLPNPWAESGLRA
jgi:hypothetical protein